MSADDVDAMRAALLKSGAMPEELRRVVDAGEPVWDTAGLQRDYEVMGFAAPFVVVRRRSDGQVGSLSFTHMPRFYFDWRRDDGRAEA